MMSLSQKIIARKSRVVLSTAVRRQSSSTLRADTTASHVWNSSSSSSSRSISSSTSPLCWGSQQTRFFSDSSSSSSSSSSFSTFEYPTRTEAPEIVQTNAKDLKDLPPQQQSSSTKNKLYHPSDPFDEHDTIDMTEREERKQQLDEIFRQKQIGGQQEGEQQNPSSSSITSSSLLLPITTTIPSFVPPNVPSDQLQVPETIITTLDNGIRVVSQEMYGQMSTVGVLTNVGSRHEKTTGTVHLLETMAFGSTKHLDGLQISEFLQDWGATRFVSYNREQTLCCIDILRPNVEKAMTLLSEVILQPRIGDVPMEDFFGALDTMAFQAQEQLPQLILGEALQRAAYGSDQQLGKFHFATMDDIPQLSPQIVHDFYNAAIIHNPQQMVIAGAGVGHDTLVELTQECFGHVTTQEQGQQPPKTIPSVYRGGYCGIPSNPASVSIYNPTVLPTEQHCHVALAFPVGGWHDSHPMVTACVLQMLLGGGSSFSAGGPGKGMYSRLYQTVLNRYSFMESAEAFTNFAEEGGLFGVTGSTTTPQSIPKMVAILAEQLLKLADYPVTEIELSRAKNMLKCNILTQLESRLVLFEDLGRQILTYGKHESAIMTCEKIDSITTQDIQQLVQGMISSSNKPTLAATGYHLDQIPKYEQVQSWF